MEKERVIYILFKLLEQCHSNNMGNFLIRAFQYFRISSPKGK